eukprot:364314-Chlamydomonas_euryale.AAC.12
MDKTEKQRTSIHGHERQDLTATKSAADPMSHISQGDTARRASCRTGECVAPGRRHHLPQTSPEPAIWESREPV